MSKRNRRQNPPSQQPLNATQSARPKPGELTEETLAIIAQRFSGPLPPPEALERYGRIIPNGAERIMVMAEEQSKHRRELEKKVMNTDSRNSFCGMVFAFILGMTAIIGGVAVIFKGYTSSGFFVSFSGLGTLVGAFIFGTRERRKEREAKTKSD
jgi:uncharacterized membrane protein